MLQSLLAFRNRIDFPLRQGIRWRRPFRHNQNESKEDLFAYLPSSEQGIVAEQEIALRDQYRLTEFYRSSSCSNYRENLYYLELLILAFKEAKFDLPQSLKVADIGVSHWFYVQALYNFLQWHKTELPRDVNLSGYELDPNRVYSDLRSRYDHALAHINDLPRVNYITEGFQALPQTYDLITLFFPFVFPRDHLRWGLPANLFDPEQLLMDAWSSLKPGGGLLIVNQGLEEHEAQREMLTANSVAKPIAIRHESLFYAYDLPRFALLSVKPI